MQCGTFPREDYNFIKSKKLNILSTIPILLPKNWWMKCLALWTTRKTDPVLSLAKSAIHTIERRPKDMTMPVCLIWGKQDAITTGCHLERISPLTSEKWFILDRSMQPRSHDGTSWTISTLSFMPGWKNYPAKNSWSFLPFLKTILMTIREARFIASQTTYTKMSGTCASWICFH